MYKADDFYDKLNELKELIRQNSSADGTVNFEPDRVLVSLELCRRMITQEEIKE